MNALLINALLIIALAWVGLNTALLARIVWIDWIMPIRLTPSGARC